MFLLFFFLLLLSSPPPLPSQFLSQGQTPSYDLDCSELGTVATPSTIHTTVKHKVGHGEGLGTTEGHLPLGVWAIRRGPLSHQDGLTKLLFFNPVACGIDTVLGRPVWWVLRTLAAAGAVPSCLNVLPHLLSPTSRPHCRRGRLLARVGCLEGRI